MYPSLKVKLNKELDKKVCASFLNVKKAGVNFGAGIIKRHPSLGAILKLPEKKRKFSISVYVDWFYQENLKALEEARKKGQDGWNKKAKSFFAATDKYFEDYAWPKGKYIAYISVFNCNPRFLENKTFQVFREHQKGFSAVAVHEMLHFLFYDFVARNFPESKFSEEELWELSEVINYFLLSEPKFIEITGDPYPDLYPELKGLAERLEKLWSKTRTIKKFLDLYFS